jgi:hypothetical protein
MQRPLFVLIAMSALIILACSGGDDAANADVPTSEESAAVEPPEETPSTVVGTAPDAPDQALQLEPEPIVPFDRTTIGWVANIEERAARGDWTLVEGIVATLQLLAGEADAADVYPTQLDDVFEGTGVLRLARQYLEDGTDPDARSEIARLLGDLVLSQERLEAMVIAESPLRRRRSRATGTQQPLEDCNRFFGDRTTPGVSQCLQVEVVTVEGVEFRIYLPAPFLPNVGWERSHVDQTVAALQDTIPVYRRFGIVPPGPIVFSVTPAADAMVLADTPIGACSITLYPRMQQQTPANFKQTVAHELAHCFFLGTYPEQSKSYAHTQWIEESGAEYLSNVVYPPVNDEHARHRGYQRLEFTTGLLDRTYTNASWMQHVANSSGGPTGFLAFYAALPIGGEVTNQAPALAARPGLAELHHDFAIRMASSSIGDPGGGTWPGSSRSSALVFATDEGQVLHDRILPAFGLDRVLVDVPRGTSVTLILTASDAIATSVGQVDETGWVWQRVAQAVPLESTCASDVAFLLVTTTTSPSPNLYHVDVDTVAEMAECDSEEEEPADAEAPEFITGIDACLVGTWELDPEAYLNGQLASDNVFADSIDQRIEIDVVMELRADGTVQLEIRSWGERYEFDSFDMEVQSSGTGDGRWGADGLLLNGRWNTLDFETDLKNPVGELTLEAPPAHVLVARAGPYICDAGSFTYTDPGNDIVPGFAPVIWLRQ